MQTTCVVQPQVTAPAARAYRAESTILLVDDDPDVLRVLNAVLTHEGYEVVTAASPMLALEFAAINAFSMLITDYQMPAMDGFALASLLTQKRRTLPVLLISGSHMTDLPVAEITVKQWNFLSKPLDRARLLRVVDGECLRRVPVGKLDVPCLILPNDSSRLS